MSSLLPVSRGTRLRSTPSFPALLLLVACGTAPPPSAPGAASAPGGGVAPAARANPSATIETAARAPVPPPVPVERRGRTLVTQAPDPPSRESGTTTGDRSEVPETREPGEAAVPELRAPREPGNGGGRGGLDQLRVRDVVREQQTRFRHCFDRLRQVRENVTEARVTVRFTIAPDGSVESSEVASASPDDESFTACLLRLLAAVEFPSASSPTTVSFPFVFQVAAGGE
jgi:TonB family protein